LVASSEDRSGTSNLMTFTRTGRFVVERRDVGEGVRAWALDGYPADCVVFALAGPLADSPPDLVVSGINGGANLADDWFGSGTIGAARTAAYLGVPAIAVSGIDDDDPDALEAAVDWVLRLARSGVMREVTPPSYLTISLPVGPPSEITGIEVVDRARGGHPNAGG
jgi:5'-nucleotidase